MLMQLDSKQLQLRKTCNTRRQVLGQQSVSASRSGRKLDIQVLQDQQACS